MPAIDNKINIQSLNQENPKEKKGFFKRLFGGKDKDEKKN
jgi:hypothetical protein